MELFSTKGEPEAEANTKFHPQKRSLHPAFLPIFFPVTRLPKGRKLRSLPQPLFYALYLVAAKQSIPLVLQVQEDYIYAYERSSEFWVVRHTWSLKRLIVVELDEGKSSEMTLVFPNSSLDPGDSLKKKRFEVADLAGFLIALKEKLMECGIDLELDEATGFLVK
jgi:hypothetical protein